MKDKGSVLLSYSSMARWQFILSPFPVGFYIFFLQALEQEEEEEDKDKIVKRIFLERCSLRH